AARGEESERSMVSRAAVLGVAWGAGFGAAAGGLGYVMVARFVSHWKHPPHDAPPLDTGTGQLIAGVCTFLYVQILLWLLGWWSLVSTQRHKRKAKGGDLVAAHISG